MAVEKAIASSSLVEVVDRILDKGIVVDAWVRISLVGIELLAIEARVWSLAWILFSSMPRLWGCYRQRLKPVLTSLNRGAEVDRR